MVLLGLLVGEVFYWLVEARWMRVTLCTLSNVMTSPSKQSNEFIAHEFDRCDVATGARGFDLILNYFINDLSVFLSLSAVSFIGIGLGVYFQAVCIDAADRVERTL